VNIVNIFWRILPREGFNLLHFLREEGWRRRDVEEEEVVVVTFLLLFVVVDI